MLAIRDMERAGIDIITDGEIRRESYSNRFAHGARRHRPRQARRGASAAPASRRRAARRRADPPARARSRCATSRSCARNTDRRSRSPCPARSPCRSQCEQRILRRRGRAGDGLRRGGERGNPRSEGRRRRRDPARRALDAGPSRARPGAIARGGHQPRAARASTGTTVRAPVLRLRRDGRRQARPAIPSCRSWPESTRDADLDRGGAAEARPRRAARTCRTRRSCSA